MSKILSFAEQDLLALQRSKGFTLIEVMIAVLVLSIGILSIVLFFTFASISTDFAGDLTVATAHAESLLEEMRNRSSLFEIVHTDWKKWAQSQGLDTLLNEKFIVNFKDPNANPLEIEVTVSWMSRTRPNAMTLHGEFTR